MYRPIPRLIHDLSLARPSVPRFRAQKRETSAGRGRSSGLDDDPAQSHGPAEPVDPAWLSMPWGKPRRARSRVREAHERPGGQDDIADQLNIEGNQIADQCGHARDKSRFANHVSQRRSWRTQSEQRLRHG